MRRFCLKISAVDGMDSSGKYPAVTKLMSVRSQQHCTVATIGHVMKQQTIVLKSNDAIRRLFQVCLEKPQYYVSRMKEQGDSP